MKDSSIENKPFIGKDGKDYGTFDALDRANSEFMGRNLKFKAHNGSEHETMDGVYRANKEYVDRLSLKSTRPILGNDAADHKSPPDEIERLRDRLKVLETTDRNRG